MPSRSDYLARTLIARMRSLDAVLAEDGAAPGNASTRRLELVEKVLAVEAGVLDGAVHRTVLSALPTATPGRAVSERETSEFSEFLRQRLPVET